MKLLIKNGTIITASANETGDILIEGGHITVIGSSIPADGTVRTIDAEGMYILPGGVDPHVHMHLPVAGAFSSDDFHTGSRAALSGGTTTLIDFVTPARGESLVAALEKRRRKAGNSLCDYAFHVSPVEWRSTTAEEIMQCVSMGVSSFKVYMAYKDTVGLGDDDLLRVMKTVAKEGGLVTVHCEAGDEIEQIKNRFIAENKTTPEYHALSRPASLEAAAVKRAIDLAAETECPLYIVHLSSAESLNHIREAKSRGQKVYAETCPQYLMLDDSKYRGDFEETAPYVISPPLRKPDDCEALWLALSDGTIDTVGTDHCPFLMPDKRAGINDFRKIPGGAGGVEHRLSLLYTYGYLTKRLNINQMVNLFAANPAKIFGLYPRKGQIMTGSDADLVIWNPEPENIISVKTHRQNCDTNIYEGITVNGNADYVIARGKVIIENGDMVGAPENGKYLFRTICGPPVET
ncbi:MAG: dihydropyrimidinase [Bacteroidales bacterium]|nr:dihydropyrimidinase [Bacteroidales bacterium]